MLGPLIILVHKINSAQFTVLDSTMHDMNFVVSKNQKKNSQNSNGKPIQFLVALATTTLNCTPPNCMYPPILEEGN